MTEKVKETYTPDGKLATRIEYDPCGLPKSITQFDENGHVTFCEKIDENTKITYRDGKVATILQDNGKY